MLNLEIPGKFSTLVAQSHQIAVEVFRPNSRKYDTAEHEYPRELDMLAALIDGMNESGALSGAGAGTVGAAPTAPTARPFRPRAATATAPIWQACSD